MPSTVTVVVPAHNEEAFVAATVAAIRTQTYPVSRILVVDDGSSDATAAKAIAAGAEVLETPGGSKPRAQNLALATINTDVVVGVDADTVLAPDAVEHLMRTIDAGADGTCGAVLPAQRRGVWVRGRAFEYAVVRGWMKPVQQCLGRMHVLSGAVYAFRTDTLRAVGGHPEVAIGEDTELTWRLYGAGYRLAYSPKALAFTQEPETLGEFWRQNRRWAASSAQVVRRHWRQLSHPGRALIVASAVWDYLGVFLLGLVSFFGLLQHPGLGRLIGPWLAIMTTVSTAVAARSLGWRYAIACVPARFVTSTVARLIYGTTFLREWVLGRHYLSWTGRQATASVISPMSSRRRVLFSGLTGVGAVIFVLGALETTAVVTGQPSPTREALEFVSPDQGRATALSEVGSAATPPAMSPTTLASRTAPPVSGSLRRSPSVPEPVSTPLATPVYAPSEQATTTEPRKSPLPEGSTTTTTANTVSTKPTATTITTPPTAGTPTTTTTTMTESPTTTEFPSVARPPAAVVT